MNALHKSLDETVTRIREEHELELKQCNDRVFAAELKATLLQDQLARAVEDRTAAERIAVKLITQFGMVEAIFADAKALALAHAASEIRNTQIKDDRLPEVALDGQTQVGN